MKQYRVKPENINPILWARMLRYFPSFVVATGAVLLYLYYLNPSFSTFDSWADFLMSSTMQITGAIGGTIILGVLVRGYVVGSRSLRSLVVTENVDHVAWRVSNEPEQKIYYKDMIRLKERKGTTLQSISNVRLSLFLPKQIDDFEELQRIIDERYISTQKQKESRGVISVSSPAGDDTRQ